MIGIRFCTEMFDTVRGYSSWQRAGRLWSHLHTPIESVPCSAAPRGIVFADATLGNFLMMFEAVAIADRRVRTINNTLLYVGAFCLCVSLCRCCSVSVTVSVPAALSIFRCISLSTRPGPPAPPETLREVSAAGISDAAPCPESRK